MGMVQHPVDDTASPGTQALVKYALEMLETLATERPDDYALFWRSFGPVLKEGLHFDPSHSDKIAPLLRYESSAGGKNLTSLADYVKRMPEGQTKIYYAQGPSSAVVLIPATQSRLMSALLELSRLNRP